MSNYPDKHHPVFFLQDALHEAGADAVFNNRDEQTLGCWGLIVNGQPFVWLIDVRWPHENEREEPAARALIERGALVCCAQKPDAERLGAQWLPLAATPGYKPALHNKLHDVAMVGYVRDWGRAWALADVAKHFTLYTAQGVFGADAVEAYQSARCGLNVPTRYGDPAAYDSANMRCFEILACGVPLVTSAEAYLTELGIVHGETAALYPDADGIISAINFALTHPEIGASGAALVQSRHTYRHRAEQVLSWLQP